MVAAYVRDIKCLKPLGGWNPDELGEFLCRSLSPFLLTLELVCILIHHQKGIVLCKLQKLLLVALLRYDNVYLAAATGAQIFLYECVVIYLLLDYYLLWQIRR